MKKEDDSNESKQKKGALGCAAFLALTYFVVMAVVFAAKGESASVAYASDEYLCVNEDMARYEAGESVENYAELWITWMNMAFYCFTILSILAILSMVGACVPAARCVAASCGCCGSCFHLITVIGLTVVRFSDNGKFCAEPIAMTLSGEANIADIFNQMNGI